MGLTQNLIFGLVWGSYLAVATIGFTLVYGILDTVNFAYGEYMTIGAYVGFFSLVTLELGLLPTIVVVAVVTGAIGWALARLVFTPIEDMGGLPILLTSIGLGIVLRNVFRLGIGPDNRYYKMIPDNSVVFRTNQAGGVFVNELHLVTIVGGLVFFVGIHLMLTRTETGKAMRAMSDDKELALVVGINTSLIRDIVWVLSSVAAGIAGLLIGAQAAVNPFVGFDELLLVLTAAIIGGAGSAYGAIIGAFLITISVSVVTMFLPTDATSLGITMAYIMLVVLLLVRPGGIARTGATA